MRTLPTAPPAAATLPLERFELFHTRDVDEARDRVGRIFCPHRLDLSKQGAELDARHHSAPLSRAASLNYVQYGPAVDIHPGCLGDFYLLQIPLRGGAWVQCGAQQTDATPRLASLPSPTEPLRMRWHDDSPHLIVRLARAAVQAHAEQLLQAPLQTPLVFDLGVAIDAPAMAPLMGYLGYLCQQLDAGALPNGMLMDEAERYLMSCLLMSAPHNHSARLRGQRERAWLPRHVRRAQDYMASHAGQALSLADVCAHLGVSARSLQTGFQQAVGIGPMHWLRLHRLEGARQALLDAGPAREASVAAVAGQFGFAHLGRFASQYRQRFGELPMQTLRRRPTVN